MERSKSNKKICLISEPILSELEMIYDDLEYVMCEGAVFFGTYLPSIKKFKCLLDDYKYILDKIGNAIKTYTSKKFKNDENSPMVIIDDLISFYSKLERMSNKYNNKDDDVKGDKAYQVFYKKIATYKSRIQEILEYYFNLVPYKESIREVVCRETQIPLRIVTDKEICDKFTTRTVNSGFINKETRQLFKKEIVVVEQPLEKEKAL